jgi:hypothetical protein
MYLFRNFSLELHRVFESFLLRASILWNAKLIIHVRIDILIKKNMCVLTSRGAFF